MKQLQTLNNKTRERLLGLLIAIPVLLLILLGSCVNPNQSITPITKHTRGGVIIMDYDVITIDSCEYIIVQGFTADNIVIIHKANCKNHK